MALVKSGTFGSGPAAMYELHADQISGSGTNRTVKVTLKLKVNGSTSTSKYGYGLTWKARVKDTYSGNQNIKGNEYWYGGQAYREFSQTINANIGTTASSSIVVGFQLWRTDGGSSSWNQTITGNYTVTNTNTAPYFPSGQQYVTIREGNNSSGTVLTGVIPENISQVFVHWGKASDNEGDSINYSLQHQVNNGNWSQIDYGADQEHSYTIGAGNQGQTLKYSVDAVDKNGAWSTKIYSNVITKNTFTGSNLSDIAAIYYNTTELKLTWSAPSNTTTHANANAFNFSLTCDGLTLYNANATNTTTSLTFKIVNSALTDGTPYILKNDLKNKFQGSAYKGNLAFTLTSSNAYGSSKTSTKICAVDLQSTPNASSSASISTDAAKSTCYQKPISSVNTYYFIPDGSKTIRVEWSAGSGKIGEPISYDVYVAYGSDSWTLLQSNLTTTYYNHVVPKQNISRTIKYRIATKTNYGTSAFKDTATQTLHYYNLPTITIGNITRAATTATVPVTVKTETSLSGVTTIGTWSCVKKGTTSAVSSGNLTTSQTSQNIAVTGLTDTGQFELKIVFKDNTIFSSNANAPVVNIGQVSSIFFVNKYGVGINGAEANDKQVLVIRGAMGQNAGVITDFNNALTEGEYYFTASTINGPVASRYGKVIVKVNDGGMHNNSSNWIWQIAYLTDDGAVYRRNKTNSGAWKPWVRQYDTGYKPSAADIGASPSNHNHNGTYLPLSGGTLTNKLRINNSDANTDNSAYLELYRSNGVRGALISSHNSGLGLRIHTYDNAGTWKANYTFDTTGTIEAVKFKAGKAYLNSSTLRLEKGYGGNYSQIFFKGQTNDDGRIIHWENNNSSQLWLMPSDDPNAESDEVIIGTVSNKNDVEDMSSGGLWTKSITMNTRGQVRCTSDYPYICFRDNDTRHGAHTWTIGSDNGYFYIHTGSRNNGAVDSSSEGPLLGCFSGSYTNWRFRGSQIYMNGTSVSTSDKNMKENIVSISDVELANEGREKHLSSNDYKNFVRDMNFYSYDYLKVTDNGETCSSYEEQSTNQDVKREKFGKNVYHNIGIIAQDYDYENDPIAKQFIFKDYNSDILLYNKDAFTGILGIALKENIKEVAILNERVTELEKLLNKNMENE